MRCEGGPVPCCAFVDEMGERLLWLERQSTPTGVPTKNGPVTRLGDACWRLPMVQVTSGRSGCGQGRHRSFKRLDGVPSRMMFALLIIGSVVAGGRCRAELDAGRGGHPRHLQLRPGLCDGRFRRRRYRFGVDGYYGSMPGGSLSAPVVGGAATENQGGYWEVGSDGAIYNFGDAGFHGSSADRQRSIERMPEHSFFKKSY